MKQHQKARPDPKAGAVLTIAGTDPSGGAGIQRDLKTFEDFGLCGLSVITALTAQNQKRVKAVFPVPVRFVVKQIESLVEGYRIDVVKLGMLATGDIVLALVRLFKHAKFKKIVVDPVLVSSSGYPLLDKKGVILLKERLLPLATIVTPNLNEAAVLAGMKKVSNPEDMKQAAIKSFSPSSICPLSFAQIDSFSTPSLINCIYLFSANPFFVPNCPSIQSVVTEKWGQVFNLDITLFE